MKCAYRDLHALSSDELHAAHNVLLHLHEHSELSAELGGTKASTRLKVRSSDIKLHDHGSHIRMLSQAMAESALAKQTAGLSS